MLHAALIGIEMLHIRMMPPSHGYVKYLVYLKYFVRQPLQNVWSFLSAFILYSKNRRTSGSELPHKVNVILETFFFCIQFW